MRLVPALAAFVLCTPLCALAQTYTPKQIRVDASPGTDVSQVLQIANLKSAVSLSKEEIEAALQRIADTGLFTDISYTVNSDALVIKLSAPEKAQSLPVSYANFVWWQPEELERLVEARVPLFHGNLPLTGTLTDQVEAALVELMRTKGVQDAKIETRQSSPGPSRASAAMVVEMVHPEVVIREVKLDPVLGSVKPQIEQLYRRLRGQEFNLDETRSSIQLSVVDVYQNAGYLDAKTTTPTYSAPQKDMDRYVVDVSATIQPGDQYHVAHIDTQAAAPLIQTEVAKAALVKVGDPASPMSVRLAKGEIEQVYSGRAYLDARANVEVTTNTAAHTVAYSITTTAGEPYHFAGLDTTALTPAQQATIAHEFTDKPGVLADSALTSDVVRALAAAHLPPKLSFIRNATAHTVTIQIKGSTNR